jgi:acyl-CoA thioester hydrolase
VPKPAANPASPPPPPDLAEFPVVVRVPVAWGDMDAFGHVNNTFYFRYFETARILFFERTGFNDSKRSTGIGPILAETRCRFRRPLKYPDTVAVGTRARDVEADRFSMDYVVWSEALGEIAASGEGLIVSYDYAAGRKAPLPEAVRAAMERLGRA